MDRNLLHFLAAKSSAAKVGIRVCFKILSILLIAVSLGSCTPASLVSTTRNTNNALVEELTEDFLNGVTQEKSAIWPTLGRWEYPIRFLIVGHYSAEEKKWADDAITLNAMVAALDARYAMEGETANVIVAFVDTFAPEDVISELRTAFIDAEKHGIRVTPVARIALAEESELTTGNFPKAEALLDAGKRFRALIFRALWSSFRNFGNHCLFMPIVDITSDRTHKNNIDTRILITSTHSFAAKERCTNVVLFKAFGFNITSFNKNKNYPSLTNLNDRPILRPTYYDYLFLKTLYGPGVQTGMTREALRPVFRNLIAKQLAADHEQMQKTGE